MSSKAFGENVVILSEAGTITGTTMIVKAYSDGDVDVIFNDGTEITVSIVAFATIEGVRSVTYNSATVAVYK